jgi:hypothetical protein
MVRPTLGSVEAMQKEPHRKFQNAEIIEALTETRGNLTEAAKFLVRKTGLTCTRAHLKMRTESDPELLGYMDDLRQELLDRAEDNIFMGVFSGDKKDSMFILRTLGKERGYVPKEEVDASLSPETIVAAIKRGRERAANFQKPAEAEEVVTEEPLGSAESDG